ncbi:MAG: FAD-dependent oxidoreductase [Clostridiales bacterium]|nr:FAD-dependent oxidoreductase [Clostridiales bacterium]
MRILIIGGVAAGTSAATEIRRQDKNAQIRIYERDTYISYASCGMPFYISGEFTAFEDLVPRGPEFFLKKHNTEVLTSHEVEAIEPEKNKIRVKNLVSGEVFEDSYDALIIATGARAANPKIEGSEDERVFFMRNIGDLKAVKEYIDKKAPKKAAIIGSGLVGLEMCETFRELGMETTLISRSSLARGLDPEMTDIIEAHLKEKGVSLIKNAHSQRITKTGVTLKDLPAVDADIVILATGVLPNTELAKAAGLKIGETGAIWVDSSMKTSVDNIYACGDCTEQRSIVTGKTLYRPMGSTANKTGVVAGNNAAGGNQRFGGILGTSIFRIFELTAAQTGISQQEAEKLGIDVVVSFDKRAAKPEYMGGRPMTVKTVAKRTSGRILGAQIVGYEGVDKRMDVLAAAISLNATADDLTNIDFAYAPPYSTPRDVLYYTGVKLKKAMENK